MKRILCLVFLLAIALPGGSESLWNRSAKPRNLFTDHRASTVGDIVTIVVSENAQASDQVSSQNSRKQDMQFALTALFSAEDKLFPDEGAKMSLKSDNGFRGTADHSRQSKVTAQMSATVRSVLPNGNLLVEGRRSIFVDSEQKNIIITGIIRPQDISPTNTVDSNKVADAEIIYEGFGSISDAAKPGILTRLLNIIPLF